MELVTAGAGAGGTELLECGAHKWVGVGVGDPESCPGHSATLCFPTLLECQSEETPM